MWPQKGERGVPVMSDLRDLYQDVILDHNKKPRNFHKLEQANRQADGYNPLCGDKFSIYMQIENGIVKDIGFVGTGCAISTASASMMTEYLKGKPESEAREVFKRFHHLVANHSDVSPDAAEMGELAVFAGVREYPMRAKCATLAWHAMCAALDQTKDAVATE
jgi:nitrogen fixation protein NifU and related proteins